MNCPLCDESNVPYGRTCPYCGFQSSISLTGPQAEQKRMEEHRQNILKSIEEIGFIAYKMSFDGEDFEKGKLTENKITLLGKHGTAPYENNTLVSAEQNVELYKKTGGKTLTYIMPIAVQAGIEQFILSAKINKHLKLDIYYRSDASSSDRRIAANNIKLGKSLQL